MKIIKRFYLFIFLMLHVTSSEAQFQWYNHPELDWRTVETAHFFIHYHQGTDRTASVLAKIGEEIYQPITTLYQYEPDGKVHIIVRDHDDFSNGIAYFYDNKIEMWAPSIEFPFRGTHSWLRNTFTHEFAHLISLGAARKMPRQLPAIYLQWFDYEKEKRDDVIHGYPQTLVSFPLAGLVIPLWFAEGMAQLERYGLDYERWDTHRDMLLRTAVLENAMESPDDMRHFEKNSLGRERGVYNQGYGLTLYLAYRYGEDVIPKLAHEMKTPLRTSFSSAMQNALGKDENTIYREWSDWLKKGYEKGCNSIRKNNVQEKRIVEKGFANFHPLFSGEGKKVVFLSTKKKDNLSQLSLCCLDLETGKTRTLKNGVTSSFSWSPDGSQIVYAKNKDRTCQGSHFYNLYVLDIETKKEKRLTQSLRTRQPDWSSKGQKMVCVVEKDGTMNLAVLSSDGSGFHQISDFQNGEQIYAPRWMPDGHIVFAISENTHGRNIAVMDSSGSEFDYLLKTENDERDPFPSPDGQWVYYSSDQTGIFNIYRMNPATSQTEQLTNVLGGAFMPSVDKNGRLVYSSFQIDGYKIAMIESPEPVSQNGILYRSPYEEIRVDINKKEWNISECDDTVFPVYSSRPYKAIYSKISFLPRIMLDYPGTIKLGTYFYGGDFLDKTSLFGTVAVNGSLDADIFGMFEFRKLYPTLFLEGYHQIRHSTFDDTKYAFNLSEVDLGADWPVTDRDKIRTAYVFSRYGSTLSWKEAGQKMKFSYTYHIGNMLQFKWKHFYIPSSIVSNIAPSRGRSITFFAERNWQRFFEDFEVHQDYGTLIEKYKKYDYFQFALDWREFLPGFFRDHSVALRFRSGYIDRPVDSFYNLFAGGLDGLRGYSFYSIEGRKLIQTGVAYRFPIFRKMEWRLGFLQFHKLYLSVYAEAGDAWDAGGIKTNDWKRDVGVQMRLAMQSFDSYPISLFVDGSYGLDTYVHRNQRYGGEWRFYFGVLFNFLDLMDGFYQDHSMGKGVTCSY